MSSNKKNLFCVIEFLVLPDHRLWYGLQVSRNLHSLLPLLPPGVRQHVEVIRAELGRVRQLHGRDEVGAKNLQEGKNVTVR